MVDNKIVILQARYRDIGEATAQGAMRKAADYVRAEGTRIESRLDPTGKYLEVYTFNGVTALLHMHVRPGAAYAPSGIIPHNGIILTLAGQNGTLESVVNEILKVAPKLTRIDGEMAETSPITLE